MKQCYKCNLEQESGCFSKDKTTSDGLCARCKSCTKLYRTDYEKQNSSKISSKKQEYYQENKEILNETHKQYNRENKTKLNEYSKTRRASDINFKLTLNIRQRVSKVIKKGYKKGSSIADLGCSLSELKIHLEAKFKPGMSWDNYGKGSGKWSIDHIQPLSRFNLSIREDFLKACSYTNLQPLWAYENSIKGDKQI